MKKRLLVVLMSVLLLLLLTMSSCTQQEPTPAPYPAQAPAPITPIELKLASFQPTTNASYALHEEWAKKIESETGGKVKITIYAGETLAKAKVTYDAVVQGTADIGWTLPSYTPGRFSLTDVGNLPVQVWDSAEQASDVLWSLWETFPEMREQYKDTHVLWFMTGCPSHLHSTKAAPHVEDMKGMKIRTPAAAAAMAEGLGAVPVELTGGEVYEGFAKGVIDGDFHSWEAPVNYRWYEVIDYSTQIGNFIQGTFVATMNLDTYNKLPDDVKKVIDKNSGRWASVELYATGWDKGDEENFEFLKANTKIQIFQWTEEDYAKAARLTKPAVNKWIAEREAKGLPGQKMYDEMLSLIEKSH